MGVFQPVNYLAFGKACFGCHTVHGGSDAGKLVRMAVGAGVTCVICIRIWIWEDRGSERNVAVPQF